MKQQRHVLRFFLFPLLFAGFLASAIGISTAFAAQDKVVMSPYLTNQAEVMVRHLWKQEPEYQENLRNFHRVPNHFTGEADLNDDQVKEIFVRHSDDLSDFCAQPEAYQCRAHVYMVRNNALIEIARFMAGPDIVVSPDKSKGFHNIMTQDPYGHLVTYVWNGSVYEPQ